MRVLYTALWWLLLPLAFVYLLWRSRRQPDYRRHWRERWGRSRLDTSRPLIWLHAVSVGETRAAAPLVEALLARHPGCGLLLTHATPTGRAAGAELFAARYGPRFQQAYLPYDLPPLVAAFLARARPVLGVIMETEVWPNLFAACARRGVPLYLVNARLSERSARGYARLAGLTRAALAQLSGVAAQGEADATRLRALGAAAVTVTGNLKFDVTPPATAVTHAAALRARLPGRFVVLAASTREGEEALILPALAGLAILECLLLIVPRHPQRFAAVADLVTQRGLACARRSEPGTVKPEVRVMLGDSMGEMAMYYAVSDVAFIGGSLLPLGGQNLIEAAAAGRPILIGPHTWNFAEVASAAIAAGAAMRVADADALATAVTALYRDPARRARMSAAGLAFSAAHRGATERVMALLENYGAGAQH